MSGKANYQQIIKKSLEILIEKESVSQKEICAKLLALDYKFSLASMSNLASGKNNIGPATLKKAALGLQELLRIEYGLGFQESSKSFIAIPNSKTRVIFPEVATENPKSNTPPPPFHFYDGRLDVPQKVAFFQQAQSEIIEVGLRLSKFKNYFLDVRESGFSDPISEILEKGIDFNCFVLKPDGNFSRRYFEDRAEVLPNESIKFSTSQQELQALIKCFKEINKKGHPGQMKLHAYEHFPYFHATVIDGNTERAQMHISPYLYGLSRANSPVLQLSKRQNKILFKKYWTSIKAFTTHSVFKLV